jgi:hypothetical protein
MFEAVGPQRDEVGSTGSTTTISTSMNNNEK